MKYFFLLISSVTFFSCSSYVSNIHKQIAHEQRVNRGYNPPPTNRLAGDNLYREQFQRPLNRFSQENDRRPIQNPRTLGGRQNSANTRNLVPDRRSQGGTTQRAQAQDFKDNSDDGSLWSEKNSQSFLFVSTNDKKKGDIIIVEVMSSLKERIQRELKRTFPEPRKRASAGKTDDKKEEEKEEEKPTVSDNPNQVYDRISTQVIEEINKDYLLVKGQKEVLFRDVKRFIEFQAVVPKKNLSDNDSIVSDSILEPKISVMRY